MGGIVETIMTVLFLLWLIGFALHFGGEMIHLLLIVAVALFLYSRFSGRRWMV